MNKQNKVLIILLLLPFFLFLSPEEESHASPLIGYLAKIFNFLVLFGGLGFMLRKPIKNFLESRGQEIDTSIKEAKKERKESEKNTKTSWTVFKK